MSNQYHHLPVDVVADGNDSQPVTNGRWLKVGAALSVSCVVLLGIVTASSSMSTLHSTSAVESTNLLGLSRSLRSPIGGAVQNGITNPMARAMGQYSFASSPVAQLAILGIQANRLDNLGVRDVSLNAQMKTVMASMDKETKEEVAKVAQAVNKKAVTVRSETAFKKEDLAGVTGPLGFFDPMGFAADVEEGRLLFLREAELKHGRVGMLAAVGILVGEKFHPLWGGDIDVPSYVAFQQTPLQTFWVAVITAIGFLEIPSVRTFNANVRANQWKLNEGRVPGDFGFDPLGFKPKEAGKFKEMQTKEINNGRLAMLAAAGMIAQELATGTKVFG